MYNIFFLEENDNIRILFDKSNLVNDLIDLYKQINVKMNVENANTIISQLEKDMIMKTLGINTFKKEEDSNIRSILLEVVAYVQLLERCKNKIIKKKIETHSPFPSSINNSIVKDDNIETPIGCSTKTTGFSYIMDTWWNEEKTITLKNSICILYNKEYECSLLCNYSKKIKEVADEFGDFLIIREYNDIPEKNVIILKDLIDNNMYCEKTDIEKKLDSFEYLYDVKKINQNENEKSLIIFYIKQNYIISDDINKKIKVSVLLEEVETELRLSNNSLKYNFANYLYDIGLQKKRYTDGMYLYGIESRAAKKINICDKHIKNTSIKNYEKLLNSRNIEIEKISYQTCKIDQNIATKYDPDMYSHLSLTPSMKDKKYVSDKDTYLDLEPTTIPTRIFLGQKAAIYNGTT
jgi:hypothetical protein